MIKIEKVETYGWESAIRGMRNPMNSWAKSDTDFESLGPEGVPVIGKNDCDLMRRLANAGNDHGKFMRMITITMDITAPLYWWKEFDTYKVGTVANSCSTMYKIHAKEFTLEDFSHEHLIPEALDDQMRDIKRLNYYRDRYLETKHKTWWWQMIQRLGTNYNQKRTVMFNYAVAKNIHQGRASHKLDEWHVLDDVLKNLPLSELITGINPVDKMGYTE